MSTASVPRRDDHPLRFCVGLRPARISPHALLLPNPGSCCSRHTCHVCESWTEEVWAGFDTWMTKRIKRSERDAAYRARKSKARRERSCSPHPSEPLGSQTERGRASTPRTAATSSAVTSASALNPAIVR